MPNRRLRTWSVHVVRATVAGLAILAGAVASGPSLLAQDETSAPIEDRISELERRYSAVVEENARLGAQMDELRQQFLSPSIDAFENENAGWACDSDAYRAGYDGGFVIVPADPDSAPFSLKFNNQNMFRYTGFDRDVRTWTDSAGVVRDVNNRSNFEIPRGRAIFSGNALLPRLKYWLSIDYNTVTSEPIGFRGYALSYEFNRSVEIHVGQNKVPGSREWLTTSLFALGPDRSLATTFFRPSLSQGVWFTGEPLDGLHYHAMLSNGFNTLNTRPDELDNRFCWSGSLWWEPWGHFGATYSDLECHESPVIRWGTSLAYSADQGQQGDPNSPENAEIRLSDGTVITDIGAFAPGVTLQKYEIGLATFDLGWKHRGFSLAGEFFLQELFGLQGDAPLPLQSTFAFGGFVQAGAFLIRQEFEVYARTSHVSGEFGTGGEYAGGFNWYFLPGRSNLRFTFDATWINHSPADQNRTDYRAGDTGLLLRTQIQTSF